MIETVYLLAIKVCVQANVDCHYVRMGTYSTDNKCREEGRKLVIDGSALYFHCVMLKSDERRS